MSIFGDHAPEQEVYDFVIAIKSEHNLSLKGIIRVLLTVMQYLIDSE